MRCASLGEHGPLVGRHPFVKSGDSVPRTNLTTTENRQAATRDSIFFRFPTWNHPSDTGEGLPFYSRYSA